VTAFILLEEGAFAMKFRLLTTEIESGWSRAPQPRAGGREL